MRIAPFLVLIVLCSLPGAAAAQALAEHVVLVSVDGFRPDFYRDATWPAPTIQHFAAEGAWAERVLSVFPSVTYPSHTAVVTGALPARSGIYYNSPFETGGQSGRWYWEEAAILVPTLWDAVRSAGRQSAGVSWPVTVGAPIDWVVPEVWALQGADRLQPMREGTRPAGLWAELEREAAGALDLRTFSGRVMSRDDETGQIAAYLLATYRPAFLALHLISPDHFQHEHGREAAPARQAVAAADSAIRAIVESAERAGILDRTAFIVTGDHGFVNVHTHLAINLPLVAAGLRGPGADRGDWRATWYAQGGSAFLHLRTPGDQEAVAAARATLATLPARVQAMFRLVERPELDAAGADPRAPLALAARLGVKFVDAGEGELVRAGSGGEHGYFPSDFPEIATGFVAWGAGIRRHAVPIHELRLVDIAPLVARLLDLPFDAPDGQAPLGVLAIEADR